MPGEAWGWVWSLLTLNHGIEYSAGPWLPGLDVVRHVVGSGHRCFGNPHRCAGDLHQTERGFHGEHDDMGIFADGALHDRDRVFAAAHIISFRSGAAVCRPTSSFRLGQRLTAA